MSTTAAPHLVQAEYDLIFAGGGTAACIIASRLATAFPNLSILVVESGPTTKGKKEHIQAGQYLSHLTPTSKAMQFYTSKPSEYLGGRSVVVPSGRCIGGGSSVNMMVYNRPAASDFDDWEKDFGNVGWSAKDMIPMLQKAETYEIDPEKPTHGSNGPLKVSFGGDKMLEIGQQFIDIGSKFEKDRPVGDEGNGLNAESINVFYVCARPSFYGHHYIYNKDLGNLSVFDGCLVNRVVVEDGVATGVEYLFDKRVHESSPQDVRIVKARKLVVVSGGAMGSPLILERSGIGKKEILEKAGIPLVKEISGVGANYQDHILAIAPYIADPDTTTFDSLLRGELETWRIAGEKWEKDGSGLLSTNGLESFIKLRPFPHELEEFGPGFTQYWNDVLADKPDRPLFFLTTSPMYVSSLSWLDLFPADHSVLPPLNFMSTGGFLGYPASRGYLHISSPDPYAAPDFEAGFLSNPVDVLILRWAYKKGREIARRLPAFRGALVPVHPEFAQDSPAALTETGPVPLDAPNIVYSAEDDKAIDAFLRQFAGTTWHSLGTCAMKPLEQGGVVDSKLNVYGVKNLKVADLSIPPSNVNSNTYSTAIAIAEKAAVLIDEELRGGL
ncbi:GMC oxidoreductase-domain-containing protein [Mycena latifolia]|nr:GMC oxidoreductase-domain-containing protein [Mycena latifolia]